MRAKLKLFLQSVGLKAVITEEENAGYVHSDYTEANDDKQAEAHMEYLKILEENENKRMDTLEGKTSQLVSQTGIVFSLLSLFVPLLADKAEGMYLSIKILLLILLLLAFAFYMLTIRNALKNYNVKNFPYSNPHPKNVITFRTQPLKEFYSEVVRDLLFSLKANNTLNNTKATNLLQSFTSFKIANGITAVLVVIFCGSLLFLKSTKPNVSIDGPVQIEHFDSLINKINKPVQKENGPVKLPIVDTTYSVKPDSVTLKPVLATLDSTREKKITVVGSLHPVFKR